MRIFVIRHGQTNYNVKHLFQGHIDIPLNNVGIKQSKETALKFQNVKIDLILVSPLKRALQTAEYIQDITQSPIFIEDRLIERCFGNMEGHENREDWNIQMMLDYEKNYKKENIEPIQDFFQRVYMCLDDITKKYKDKTIVLVTHGAVSQPIECYFKGMPCNKDFEHFEPLTLKNCEVREYYIRTKSEKER